MKMIKIVIALVVVLFSAESFYSQPPPPNTLIDRGDTRPDWMRNSNNESRIRQATALPQAYEDVVSKTRAYPRGSGETPEQRKATELEKRETLEKINNLLFVPLEYRSKYAEFLKAKNTGIVRILPDRGCDTGLVVDVEKLERCRNTPQVKGAGSLYSFRISQLPDKLPLSIILSYIGLSDIHFIDNKFVVGTESIQDIIGDIGEIELADVTIKSDGVQYVKSFKPGNTVSKVALQNLELAKGVSSNGYVYSASAPVKLNHMYIVRSIAFTRDYESFWNTDELTAFKVVGQESDGSVVILWKRLKEKSAPFLSGN